MKVSRKNLWQKIYGKAPISALEMLLIAQYGKLILAGKPDSILFQGGFPLIVFEYKFSRNRTLFDNHRVQAGTYGILLGEMGFNTDTLFNAIVIADPKAKDDDKLKERVATAIIQNGPKEVVLPIENANVYLIKFHQAKAKHELDWALGFWKKEREAVPTSNRNKCRNCEYALKCLEPKRIC